MKLLPLALVAGLLALAPAAAHTVHHANGKQVYENACCRSTADAEGGDCHPLPDGAVVAGPDGWIVTVGPAQHPLATKTHRFVIAFKSQKIRPATDGRFHLCLWPTENDDRCLYVPPQGF